MANVWDAMKKHEAEAGDETAGPDHPGLSAPTKATAAAPEDGAAPARAPEVVGHGGHFARVLVAHYDRGSAITEEYRALRTSLLAHCANERFCYLVTSAEAGEGKTVTCLNLALVLAERVDRRTVVVDCDLRKGRMSKLLEMSLTPGVAELLRGSAGMKDVTRPSIYPNLFFIAAGHAQRDEVGELIGGSEMGQIVADLKRRFDYVIFDTPPISVVSDAGIVGRATGAALLVVRMNKTHKESVEKAVRLLHATDVELAGVVLTHRKYYIPDYLYRYS